MSGQTPLEVAERRIRMHLTNEVERLIRARAEGRMAEQAATVAALAASLRDVRAVIEKMEVMP